MVEARRATRDWHRTASRSAQSRTDPGLLVQGDVRHHVARLHDTRIPLAQRQLMAGRLGALAGNGVLRHAVQRQLAAAVQRFGSQEHMRLGDIVERRIPIGGGVTLTFGQVVALAGDEFGTLEELIDATKTDSGRAIIRAHLEQAKIPGEAASLLPAPTKDEKAKASADYVKLAMDNTAHFAGGGTAVAEWTSKHADAIDLAVQAGVFHDESLLDKAQMTEAFGDHFLTDAFASGHIRMPRDEIGRYYVEEFAPAVFDHLIAHLRGRLVDEIYDQVEGQTVLNEAAWFLGPLAGIGARAYIRKMIRDEINSRLNAAFAAAGGRNEVVRIVGKGLAGVVAGPMHDVENRRGLAVVSDVHPEPWTAYGDSHLEDNPIHKSRVEEAVRVSVSDLQAAHEAGVEEGQESWNVVGPDYVPDVVYFGFDRDGLGPQAADRVARAAQHLRYHASTIVTIVGHADPAGEDPYNMDLAWRRANRVAQAFLVHGIDATRINVESMGERAPVTTERANYSLNRRVSLAYATGGGGAGTGPDDVALERARKLVLDRVGPPYVAQGHFPRPAAGLNPDVPAWKWGEIQPPLRAEMATWVSGYVNEYSADLLKNKALDDIVKDTKVGDFTISPRPIARRIVAEIAADPVGFLGRALGRRAGP